MLVLALHHAGDYTKISATVLTDLDTDAVTFADGQEAIVLVGIDSEPLVAFHIGLVTVPTTIGIAGAFDCGIKLFTSNNTGTILVYFGFYGSHRDFNGPLGTNTFCSPKK